MLIYFWLLIYRWDLFWTSRMSVCYGWRAECLKFTLSISNSGIPNCRFQALLKHTFLKFFFTSGVCRFIKCVYQFRRVFLLLLLLLFLIKLTWLPCLNHFLAFCSMKFMTREWKKKTKKLNHEHRKISFTDCWLKQSPLRSSNVYLWKVNCEWNHEAFLIFFWWDVCFVTESVWKKLNQTFLNAQ